MAVAAQHQDNVGGSARPVFALAVCAQFHGCLQTRLLLGFCLLCKIGIWELFQVLGVRLLGTDLLMQIKSPLQFRIIIVQK